MTAITDDTETIPLDVAEARARAGFEWYCMSSAEQLTTDFETLVERHLADARKEKQ